MSKRHRNVFFRLSEDLNDLDEMNYQFDSTAFDDSHLGLDNDRHYKGTGFGAAWSLGGGGERRGNPHHRTRRGRRAWDRDKRTVRLSEFDRH